VTPPPVVVTPPPAAPPVTPPPVTPPPTAPPVTPSPVAGGVGTLCVDGDDCDEGLACCDVDGSGITICAEPGDCLGFGGGGEF
jgi:hypothetical protein